MQTYALPSTEFLKVSGAFQTIAEHNGLFYVTGENLSSPFFEAQLPQELKDLQEQELQEARELKAQELNKQCDILLQSFKSFALGSEYIYDATLEDQINLLGLVIANVDGYFRCYKDGEAKQNIPHNKDQLRQVLNDWSIYRAKTIYTCGILKAYLYTLDDATKIENLTWDDAKSIKNQN